MTDSSAFKHLLLSSHMILLWIHCSPSSSAISTHNWVQLCSNNDQPSTHISPPVILLIVTICWDISLPRHTRISTNLVCVMRGVWDGAPALGGNYSPFQKEWINIKFKPTIPIKCSLFRVNWENVRVHVVICGEITFTWYSIRMARGLLLFILFLFSLFSFIKRIERDEFGAKTISINRWSWCCVIHFVCCTSTSRNKTN